MSFKAEAIKALVPDANFTMINDSQILNWDSKKEIPSEEAIKAKQTELQAEYDSKEYQRKRLAEYPSIQELVVALYDADDKAEIDKKRAEIKKKYPKPE